MEQGGEFHPPSRSGSPLPCILSAPSPLMCVGGSIGIWVAGFGSASPPPSFVRDHPSTSGRGTVLYPLRIYAEREFHFASSPLRSSPPLLPWPGLPGWPSINLGKQSRPAWESPRFQIIRDGFTYHLIPPPFGRGATFALVRATRSAKRLSSSRHSAAGNIPTVGFLFTAPIDLFFR